MEISIASRLILSAVLFLFASFAPFANAAATTGGSLPSIVANATLPVLPYGFYYEHQVISHLASNMKNCIGESDPDHGILFHIQDLSVAGNDTHADEQNGRVERRGGSIGTLRSGWKDLPFEQRLGIVSTALGTISMPLYMMNGGISYDEYQIANLKDRLVQHSSSNKTRRTSPVAALPPPPIYVAPTSSLRHYKRKVTESIEGLLQMVRRNNKPAPTARSESVPHAEDTVTAEKPKENEKKANTNVGRIIAMVGAANSLLYLPAALVSTVRSLMVRQSDTTMYKRSASASEEMKGFTVTCLPVVKSGQDDYRLAWESAPSTMKMYTKRAIIPPRVEEEEEKKARTRAAATRLATTAEDIISAEDEVHLHHNSSELASTDDDDDDGQIMQRRQLPRGPPGRKGPPPAEHANHPEEHPHEEGVESPVYSQSFKHVYHAHHDGKDAIDLEHEQGHYSGRKRKAGGMSKMKMLGIAGTAAAVGYGVHSYYVGSSKQQSPPPSPPPPQYFQQQQQYYTAPPSSPYKSAIGGSGYYDDGYYGDDYYDDLYEETPAPPKKSSSKSSTAKTTSKTAAKKVKATDEKPETVEEKPVLEDTGSQATNSTSEVAKTRRDFWEEEDATVRRDALEKDTGLERRNFKRPPPAHIHEEFEIHHHGVPEHEIPGRSSGVGSSMGSERGGKPNGEDGREGSIGQEGEQQAELEHKSKSGSGWGKVAMVATGGILAGGLAHAYWAPASPAAPSAAQQGYYQDQGQYPPYGYYRKRGVDGGSRQEGVSEGSLKRRSPEKYDEVFRALKDEVERQEEEERRYGSVDNPSKRSAGADAKTQHFYRRDDSDLLEYDTDDTTQHFKAKSHSGEQVVAESDDDDDDDDDDSDDDELFRRSESKIAYDASAQGQHFSVTTQQKDDEEEESEQLERRSEPSITLDTTKEGTHFLAKLSRPSIHDGTEEDEAVIRRDNEEISLSTDKDGSSRFHAFIPSATHPDETEEDDTDDDDDDDDDGDEQDARDSRIHRVIFTKRSDKEEKADISYHNDEEHGTDFHASTKLRGGDRGRKGGTVDIDAKYADDGKVTIQIAPQGEEDAERSEKGQSFTPDR